MSLHHFSHGFYPFSPLFTQVSLIDHIDGWSLNACLNIGFSFLFIFIQIVDKSCTHSNRCLNVPHTGILLET